MTSYNQNTSPMLCKAAFGVMVATAAVTLGGCKGNSSKEQATAKKPNIIIMMTDDHTTQALGCYGSRLVDTPNLDRIAKEGMLFNNCYVSNAISGPSRACILTGKLSHQNGFTDNSQTFDGDQQTFPKLLQNAGYQTAMVGKWHLNSDPQGFDYWSVLVGQGEYYSPIFKEAEGERIDSGYVSDIITDKAIHFLEQRDNNKPFAMLYYHKAPHRNWMPAQRHLGIYNDKIFPEPENLLDHYSGRTSAAREQMMEIDRHMWPEWDLKLVSPEELKGNIQEERAADANKLDVSRANDRVAGIKQFQAAFSRMSPADQRRWNEAYAGRLAEYPEMAAKGGDEYVRWKYQLYMQDYCATLKAVDENVGRMLDYLESIGQLDNTIIVYTSDQGFFLGEHGWFDKRFMYEECQRTPLMVRYPKAIKAGTRTDALAMNIDFAPTLLDYAGVEIPADMQGISLKPVLDNAGAKPQDWRSAVYYHYYEYPSWHMVKRHYGVRSDRYKLIHFYNDVDEWELYDMQADPKEMKNVYDDPAYAGVRKEMHVALEKLQAQYKDIDPDEKEHEFFKGADQLH